MTFRSGLSETVARVLVLFAARYIAPLLVLPRAVWIAVVLVVPSMASVVLREVALVLGL